MYRVWLCFVKNTIKKETSKKEGEKGVKSDAVHCDLQTSE